MSTTDEALIYDNTGGPSPDEKIQGNWPGPKTPWPTGKFNGLDFLFPDGDPRLALLRRLSIVGPDDWVMVKKEEIKAILHLRICRSTHEFDSDEDGPIALHTAYCILEAGHNRMHTNGYYRWSAQPI